MNNETIKQEAKMNEIRNYLEEVTSGAKNQIDLDVIFHREGDGFVGQRPGPKGLFRILKKKFPTASPMEIMYEWESVKLSKAVL